MVGGFASERKNALNGQCQISIGMFAVWFIIKFVNIVITFPKCIQNAVLCCRYMMVLRTHYLHVFHIPKGNFCDNFVSFVPLVNRKNFNRKKHGEINDVFGMFPIHSFCSSVPAWSPACMNHPFALEQSSMQCGGHNIQKYPHI